MSATADTVSRRLAPTPPGDPLLGNLRAFSRDMLGTISAARERCGDIIRFRLGNRRLHVTCHPDGAQEVFVAKKDRFIKLSQINRGDSVAIVLGDGLLSSHGAVWQRQRRMMQPIFHNHRVQGMGEKITAAGDRLLRRWAALPEGDTVLDVSREMARVTLDVISRTMFDAAVDDRAERIQQALDVASKYVFDRVRNPLMAPQHWPTPRNRAFHRALRTLDETVLGIIEQRQRGGPGTDDLLDMLLAARDPETGEGMSARQIRDEVATVFSAGHETTAAALTWTWMLLARHPEASARVHAELDAVLDGRTPAAEDYERLNYTRAVFEESLRLYPPGPLVVRAAAGQETLGGYAVPARSTVLVSIYHIHRHPGFWAEPEAFRPERFLDPGARPPRHVYLPFSLGQRMCIGGHLAMLEAVLLLAQIAQRFSLAPVDDRPVPQEAAITLRPARGLPMRLQARRPTWAR